MEAVNNQLSYQTQEYIPSINQQYQKYCNINLSKQAGYNKIKEKLYQTAAVIAIITGMILLVGTVTGMTIGFLCISGLNPIFAAPGAGLILVGGTNIYRRVFYKGFENKYLGISFGLIPWKRKAKEYQRNADIYQTIAETAKTSGQKWTNLSIPQSNFIGRMKYWVEVADSADVRIKKLKKDIQKTRNKIQQMQANSTPEELKTEKEQFSLILRESHRIIATEYIPAKIKTAYFYHIVLNPTETRGFEEFGTLKTDSYLEFIEGVSYSFFPNIFYSNIHQSKKNWNIQELMRKDYKAIAQEIFSKTIK